MKTVGQQLQEARLAKKWTPEMAARETKIKVDRVRDLEGDDYSHFTSPTYARGFVRTYARLLGLDEYKILRQLDNKLPDDDSSNLVTDTGVAYRPETTSLPPRAAHRDYTGLYVVMGLGAGVLLVSAFVILEAYRVGELSRYFASGAEPVTPAVAATNSAPVVAAGEPNSRALPIDSNTPPPIADAGAETNSVARALPVEPTALASDTNDTNAVAGAAVPEHSMRAVRVDPSELTAAPPANGTSTAAPPPPFVPPATVAEPNAAPPDSATTTTPPRALPVSPAELAADSQAVAPAETNIVAVAVNTPPPSVDATAAEAQSGSPRPAAIPTVSETSGTVAPTSAGPVVEPPPPVAAPVDPAPDTAAQSAAPATGGGDKPLVLTASQDSFVRVTNLDAPDAEKPLYAAVLHNGQSIGFDGHKFSINVGIPSAVDIKLDGVNYGPHSDQAEPETFTVQSHLP